MHACFQFFKVYRYRDKNNDERAREREREREREYAQKRRWCLTYIFRNFKRTFIISVNKQ